MALSDLIEKNRRWAAAQLQADPDFFARLSKGQQPRLLWIGCSDSRVPAETVLGVGPGELFVHRNVANIVAHNDVNIASVIEFATGNLGVQDIVVCGHYGCGGVHAACQEQLPSSYLGDWLTIVTWARKAVDERSRRTGRPLTGDAYHRAVVEENVRLQLTHLAQLTVIRTKWEKTPGIPRLHGWVYDLGTGLINVVPPGDT